MAPKRSYADGCATAHALDLVGERWALLVVRELLLGPKRFTDLRAGLPGIGPNVLAQRLRELNQAGVLHRRELSWPSGVHIYELTDWGHGLDGVIFALGRWGLRSPTLPPEAPVSTDGHVLSLRLLFDRSAAAGLVLTLGLHLDQDPFRVEIADGTLALARGDTDNPDAAIHTTVTTFDALLRDGGHFAEALRRGWLTVRGDLRTAALFPILFSGKDVRHDGLPPPLPRLPSPRHAG
ncbi:DNA-binding HxlR family transcriptional regulator [Actinokineospora baliensis]|uniref:winged helix-turn-helix transcriptional regulator n=1 Tax=Actinokineospora baliensis TaxID=547056 RepID=UPI00195A4018|nr:winged helix-turn-helix transcriptional regulator [Actinokineospora baliensis]MBM7774526.1 DNA-binding HxlR family transcriptional regulator [Actinokineospora baliensis]